MCCRHGKPFASNNEQDPAVSHTTAYDQALTKRSEVPPLLVMPVSCQPCHPIRVTLYDSMECRHCHGRSWDPSRHLWWPANGPAETIEGGFTEIPKEVLIEATIFAWPWSLDMDSSAFPSSVQILSHHRGLQYHEQKALSTGSPDLDLQWERRRELS